MPPAAPDDAPASAPGGSSGGDNPPSKKRPRTVEAFTRRKRAAIACHFCRLRKAKCDTTRPVCGFCRHHKAKCVYDDEEKDAAAVSAAPASRYMEELGENILQSLGDIKHMLSQTRHLDDPGHGGSAASPPSSPKVTGGGPSLRSAYSDRDAQSSPRLLHPATRCEAMLQWPVFKGVIDEKHAAIQYLHFEAASRSGPSPADRDKAVTLAGIDENAFVFLCRKFIAHIYPRNPIVDKEALLSYAKDAAANGLQWNAPSCLVLLACALAHFTAPCESAPESRSGIPTWSINQGQDMIAAQGYWQAAKKRIGLLGDALIDIQCLFFASVFERHALRPLDAWFYIQMACTRLETYLLRNNRQSRTPVQNTADPAHLLEQRVFWTCVKGESEIAPELALRPSGLADFSYPYLLPTPPMAFDLPSQEGTCEDASNSPVTEVDENRGWLFYLAEISLRRTITDTVWLFYHDDEDFWLNNADLVLRRYIETDKQIAIWYSHLPPSIRFQSKSEPSNEFSFHLQHRFLEWRAIALRPLLYIYLHHATQPSPELVRRAKEALKVATELIALSKQDHRHGGIWFVMRRTFACALTILAVVLRYGPTEAAQAWPDAVLDALGTLKKWGGEAPDIELMANILDDMIRSTSRTLAETGAQHGVSQQLTTW